MLMRYSFDKNKKSVNYIYGLLSFFAFLMTPTLSYSGTADATCLDLIDEVLISQELDALEKKLESWQGHEAKCSDKDIYNLGQARIYLQAGKINESKDSVKKIAVEKSLIKTQVEHVKADIRLYEILTQESITKSILVEAFALYENLVNKYPKYYGGYQGLGKLLLSARQYEKCAQYSTHSIKLKPTFNAYRNLSLASFQLKKYRAVTDAAKSGFLMNAELLSDQKLMLATATSYHELGENEKSLAVLQMLAEKNPRMEKDQEVMFLKFKIEDAEKKK